MNEATGTTAEHFSPPPQAAVAPRPGKLEETGLTDSFLAELLLKHLFDGGVMVMRRLVERLALAGALLEPLLEHLRAQGLVEVRGPGATTPGLRYALTERGRNAALDALMRAGYVGPAPVPLAHYERIVAVQSLRGRVATQSTLADTFRDVVISPHLLDQLGPALNSGRAMFVYGHPGTGKSYICRRLAGVFRDQVLLPHALLVGDAVIEYFDPAVHRAVPHETNRVRYDDGHDDRFVLSHRPVVSTGGELTLDMLEVRYEESTRRYRAPIQLRANSGMLMIDDLGRQRVPAYDLLNRWIVPMEERRDYLHLAGGQHVPVVFDVLLIFSTNISPSTLADEAFLRRLGHKIRFDPVDETQYRALWRHVCREREISYAPEAAEFAIEELHRAHGVPLLPCHPRDLIGVALDYHYYNPQGAPLSPENLCRAWDSYFVHVE